MRTILNVPKNVTIEKQVYGGRGLARHEGQVIFVEDALEGDELAVEITKNHKTYAEAKIVKILQPSPYRRPAPCPYAQECGGCSWMSFADEKQIEWKKNFIASELRFLKSQLSIGFISDSSARVGYRNRIQLRGRIHKDGSLSLGYFKKSTHELIAISNCLIARSSIQNLVCDILKIKLVPSQRELKFRVDLQEVIQTTQAAVTPGLMQSSVERSDLKFPSPRAQSRGPLVTWRSLGFARDDVYFGFASAPAVTLLFEWVDRSPSHEKALLQELSSHPVVAWAGERRSKKQRFTFDFDENLNTRYLTEPGLFQQVNVGLNVVLRSQIHNFIEHHKPASVLDLYCGSGNLSMGLAYPELKSVTGFEISDDAIRVAHENVTLNKNRGTHTYKALSSFRGLSDFAKSVECIICDPPRAGMKEIIPHLIQIAPRHLVYVSCNLATLARDLKELVEHFNILEITGYDFFPQTYHVECVVFLESR